MALIQHSPLHGQYVTSVIYEAKRNQNITLKSYKKRRLPIWDLNPWPSDQKSDALPTELTRRLVNSFAVMKMSIPLPNGMILKNKKESAPSLSQLIFPASVFVGKLFRYVTRGYKSIQMCVKYQTCSLDLRLKRLQPNRTSNSFHCLTRRAIALRSGDLIKLPYLSTFFSWSYSLARTKHRCTGNTIYCLRSP